MCCKSYVVDETKASEEIQESIGLRTVFVIYSDVEVTSEYQFACYIDAPFH